MELEYGCVICEQGGEQDTLLAMSLFPPDNPDGFQQWWVHAKCIRGALSARLLAIDLREELQAVFDRAGD